MLTGVVNVSIAVYFVPMSFGKHWLKVSRFVSWRKKPIKAQSGVWPRVRWYEGGILNLSESCLDKHAAAGRHDAVALIELLENGKRRTITYGMLLEKVNRYANLFTRRGLKKGDAVIIYMPAVIETAAVMLACARIGAVHSVVFAGLSKEALGERMQSLHARAVVTADVTFRRGKEIDLLSNVDAIVGTEMVFVLKRKKQTKLKKNETDLEAAARSESAVFGTCPMKPSDPLFVLYTSGSTGKPKGIVHGHGGYGAYAAYTARRAFGLKPSTIFWCTADFGWITGHSYVLYGALANGATSLIVEGALDYPRTDRWRRILKEEKVEAFYTSPTAIRIFRKEWKGAPAAFPHLARLGSVGEPLNPEVGTWFRKYVGKRKIGIRDTWWQTETGGHLITSGIPLPGIVAKIAHKDASGKGELCIAKPWPGMMLGCFGDEARFRKYFSKEGFVTGDYARMEKGRIRILGRSDDVVNVSGHRIGSAEIENAILMHPGVAESAVIGVPDEITGEALCAFVVAKTEGKVQPEEVKLAVRKHVGAYAVPKLVRFVPSLPKTRSGKIMRRLLRAEFAGEKPGDTSTLEN